MVKNTLVAAAISFKDYATAVYSQEPPAPCDDVGLSPKAIMISIYDDMLEAPMTEAGRPFSAAAEDIDYHYDMSR